MAEFAFLAYYKDHPSDIAFNSKTRGINLNSYEKLPKRQRVTSMCTTLTPVMEEEREEIKKKAKRRFSLDFLFSKKKKQSVLKENAKRGSVDSAASSECDNVVLNPDSHRRKSSANSADLTAYLFS